MLRLFVAALAGLVAFFGFFVVFTVLTGNNDIGSVAGLLLGFLGVPVLILNFWSAPAAPYEPTAIVRQSWTRPPKCLSDVVATPVRDGDSRSSMLPNFAYFGIGCRCKGSVWRIFGYMPERNLLLCPLTLECTNCRQVAGVFDCEKHGYDAEVGNGSSGRRAEGKRTEWSCTKCRGSTFLAKASFGYQLDTDDIDEMDRARLPDLFDVFALNITCNNCRRQTEVCAYECA